MLIDIDHLLEFYMFSKKKFTPGNLTWFYEMLEYKKSYVLFHSYELLFLGGILIYFYSGSYFLSGLVLGVTLHMFLDLIGNPVYFKGYFLFYRIFTGFEKEKFIDIEKHFEKRNKGIFEKLKKNKIISFTVLIFLFSLFVSSCTFGRKKPEAYYPGYEEKGIASWYGEDFHGRPTASGEIYDMYGLTAAHKTLPLHTRVHVINLDNGRSIDVEINDRGPFVGGRIIDLSYGAAKILGMVETGVAMVSVSIIDGSRDFEYRVKEGNFTVQVGAFLVKENAERLVSKLNKEYGGAYITVYETNIKKFNRVRIGSFSTLEKAEKFAAKLEKKNYETFVARKD